MNRNELNSKLKRTNIKGKEYVEVNQRILAFWEMFPDGQIVTEKLSDNGERCDFKAEIYSGGKLMATGHAFETKAASMVNKTSYVENCETSAIGRALGILGIGITESLASAEEVASAISQQERMSRPRKSKEPVTDALSAAQKRITAISTKYAELQGMKTVEWYEANVRTRNDYSNDAETLNRIAQELEESYEH